MYDLNQRRVHVLGAGLVGCILMRRLEVEEIDFTWMDPDYDPEVESPKFCAWKASTGCVYPSGNPTDKANYEKFEDSARRLGMEYEVAEYCFSQASIPHREKSKELQVVSQEEQLKFLNKPSYHVNVQKFVEDTRHLYRRQFSKEMQLDSQIVHAHGFHTVETTDYRWGWHAKAKVNTPDNRRICFNLKEGRFVVGYLYPCPGTDEYYLGTHFIYQKEAKELEMKDKHLKMLDHIQSKVGAFADIEVDWDTLVTGWRPAYKDSEELVISRNGELFLKPQMANGLRHHPEFMDECIRRIKEIL